MKRLTLGQTLLAAAVLAAAATVATGCSGTETAATPAVPHASAPPSAGGGSASMAGDTLIYRADAGRPNAIRPGLTKSGEVLLTDYDSPITALSGCRQFDEHTVYCGGGAHVSGIDADLGDGDDAWKGKGSTLGDLTLHVAGGAGDDSVEGGPNDDVLDGGAGDDYLSGGNGTYTFDAAGGDVFDGGDGDDELEISDDYAENALHWAFETRDTVRGGPGTDTVREACGPVNLVVGVAAHGCNQSDLNVVAGDVEILRGTWGNDVLVGDGGPNVLIGGGGSDRLDGGEGYDLASYVDHTSAVDVSLDSVANDGSSGESDTLVSIEYLQGGPGDDVLTGDDGPNVLVGDGGADTLVGAGGVDVLDGDRSLGFGVGPRSADGADTIDALESGEERVRSDEAIRCGGGDDTGTADDVDPVGPDCEGVRKGGER